MKKLKIYFTVVFVSSIIALNGQVDTVLYTGFDSINYLDGTPQNVSGTKIFIGEDSLIYPGDIYDNNLQWWYNYDGDQLGVANHFQSTEDTEIFLDSTWGKWHMYPYQDLISTGEANGKHTFDTIINWGMRAISWFASPGQAYNLLLSKAIFISEPSQSTLSWRSRPLQGPRYQDGYKVYAIPISDGTPDNLNWTIYEPIFTMKEMNSNPPPSESDSSLFKIEQNQGFLPEVGVMHENYSLPDPSGSGLVDTSRQNPFMQYFEVDLSDVPPGHVQFLFLHDAHDDNAILIDDILLMGYGTVSSKELNENQLQIYPNPTTGFIHINFPENLSKSLIEVFDIQGKVVLQTTLDATMRMDVSKLNSGVYSIVIQNSRYKLNTKLIIK